MSNDEYIHTYCQNTTINFVQLTLLFFIFSIHMYCHRLHAFTVMWYIYPFWLCLIMLMLAQLYIAAWTTLPMHIWPKFMCVIAVKVKDVNVLLNRKLFAKQCVQNGDLIDLYMLCKFGWLLCFRSIWWVLTCVWWSEYAPWCNYTMKLTANDSKIQFMRCIFPL